MGCLVCTSTCVECMGGSKFLLRFLISSSSTICVATSFVNASSSFIRPESMLEPALDRNGSFFGGEESKGVNGDKVRGVRSVPPELHFPVREEDEVVSEGTLRIKEGFSRAFGSRRRVDCACTLNEGGVYSCRR